MAGKSDQAKVISLKGYMEREFFCLLPLNCECRLKEYSTWLTTFIVYVNKGERE